MVVVSFSFTLQMQQVLMQVFTSTLSIRFS